MKDNKKQLSFHINEEYHAKIKFEAARRRISMINMILIALDEYIRKPEKKD